MPNTKPNNKPDLKKYPTAFAVIGTDDQLLGYFKSLEQVERYFERECVEEAIILEIVGVIEASYPEPELELVDRPLSSLFV